jgi:hypothetical protein
MTTKKKPLTLEHIYNPESSVIEGIYSLHSVWACSYRLTLVKLSLTTNPPVSLLLRENRQGSFSSQQCWF